MKKLKLTLILIFIGISLFSQQLYTKDFVGKDLWQLTKKEYKYEKYSRPDNIEYYEKRIADVLVKYEYVISDTVRYKKAIKTNWFENNFKVALIGALEQREEFLNKNKEE